VCRHEGALIPGPPFMEQRSRGTHRPTPLQQIKPHHTAYTVRVTRRTPVLIGPAENHSDPGGTRSFQLQVKAGVLFPAVRVQVAPSCRAFPPLCGDRSVCAYNTESVIHTALARTHSSVSAHTESVSVVCAQCHFVKLLRLCCVIAATTESMTSVAKQILYASSSIQRYMLDISSHTQHILHRLCACCNNGTLRGSMCACISIALHKLDVTEASMVHT
jgi:hypothetical protein